jgi:hypothetical protein
MNGINLEELKMKHNLMSELSEEDKKTADEILGPVVILPVIKEGWKNRLVREGMEFEEYITDVFYTKFNIILHRYITKADQLKGENEEGCEIKNDRYFRTSGNLFIEIQELTKNNDWINSGILRNDNSVLYIIGDRTGVYIFEKKELYKMYINNLTEKNYLTVHNTTDTAIGILLRISDIKLYGGDYLRIIV